ncbi:MAG: alkaline phosphatase family protein [Spongiibacteraceae bacterium]|nr:alkaline phosphatase family protein [Spongiibacteraceae bacterium]
MYPSNHGLIHNQFYDRQLDDVYKMGKAQQQPLWLQATPLWTYAEQHQVRTATYFWPESDAEVDGVLPTYYFPYNKLTPYQERIDQIISWLKLPEEKRPQFITGYFSLVDSMGHKFGPDSKEVSDAVTYVDRYIGRLKKRLEQEIDFPVNLVIVSDHGMVETHSNRKIQVSSLLNLDDFKTIVSSTQLMLYAKEGIEQTRITQVAEHLNTQSQGRYSSYTKTQWPGILHYNNNDRIPDIVLEPIPPITFTDKRVVPDIVSGTHGFNPYTVPEMGAIFIANGPDFKQGMIIPAFENIHVFPVLIRLLGLAMPDNVDADPKVLESIFIN